jgi:hypothetical protein
MRLYFFSLIMAASTLHSCSTSSSALHTSLQVEMNKKIVISYFEEMVNKRILDLVDEIFSRTLLRMVWMEK